MNKKNIIYIFLYICVLTLCNLEVIKNLTLKFKRHLCCCSSKNDENKKKLEELFKLEENTDTEIHKLHDSILKFKNEIYNFRKRLK